jgi:hypothetical protein
MTLGDRIGLWWERNGLTLGLEGALYAGLPAHAYGEAALRAGYRPLERTCSWPGLAEFPVALSRRTERLYL